jgi:hypothetical protein
VFGRLVHEKRLSEEKLRGLGGQAEADPFFRQILSEDADLQPERYGRISTAMAGREITQCAKNI